MTKQLPIRWLEETDSTQNELARHISDYDNLSVVAARFQTAGRGQRGNSWVADKGENLTFSILLKFGQDRIPHLGYWIIFMKRGSPVISSGLMTSITGTVKYAACS